MCNITLGWTKITDSIKADSYAGVVKYAKPLALENGSLAAADNIAGQTLTPVAALADKISASAPSASQLRYGDVIAVQLVDGLLVCVNPITPVQ